MVLAMKRKATSTIAAKEKAERAAAKDVVEEEENEDVEMEDEEEDEVDETEEQRLAREEKEWNASRTKEVKGMYMDALKKLAESKGVTAGKKEDMVKLVIKAEAKERAEKRAHEAKIRAIVQKKSDELDALPIADLKGRANLKGRVSKTECIQHLLKTWQDEDGVDKALAQEAKDGRRTELLSKDNVWLVKHCDKNNIDPYVLEVMVDRILEYETRHDKYAPPTQTKPEKPLEGVARGGDLVEALLASEAGRKRELELQKAREAADMAKVRELNALGVDALKKLLTAKEVEAEGKKEDLVKAAFNLAKEEQAIEERKAELKAMGAKELKQLLSAHGLEAPGKIPDMVSAVLKYEKRVQEEIRAYEAKVKDLTEQKKGEFERLSLNDLKQLLVAKGLKAGVGKADRVERLAEEAQKDGSIAKKVSQMTRVERKEQLLKMDKASVLDLCSEMEIEPLVKDIMVQRIMSYEDDIAEGFLEPETKKQKTSKK